MPQKQRTTVWMSKWIFIIIMWLAWLGIAVGLAVHPLLYLTPLLAVLSSVWARPRLNGLPNTIAPPAPVQVQPPPSITDISDNNEPANLKHELLTPIRLILSFCNVILRAAQNDQLSFNLHAESVEAIQRNAKKLEVLIIDLAIPVEDTVDMQHEQISIEPVINEALTLTASLMASRNIAVNREIRKALPQLMLNRTFALQSLLNLLRGIAYPTAQSSINDALDIHAEVIDQALRISLTASANRVQYTADSPNWALTERLVEQLAGRLWLENGADKTSTIFLSFPLTNGLPETPPHSSLTEPLPKQRVIVVADHSHAADLFSQSTSEHEFLVVPDIDGLRSTLNTLPTPPLGIVLTDESNEIVLEQIADTVDAQVPIIAYNLPSPEQQLQQLRATYLAKPIDYDALSGILAELQLGERKILIVDDNVDTTTMLARMLASMPTKYNTYKTHTAQSALALLQEPDHNVGAVIIDVSLPDMDGISCIRQLRSDERFLNLPAILMSAHPTLEFMMNRYLINKMSIYRQNGVEANVLAQHTERLLNAFAPATG
jgi:CheY-like chemotaxis protein